MPPRNCNRDHRHNLLCSQFSGEPTFNQILKRADTISTKTYKWCQYQVFMLLNQGTKWSRERKLNPEQTFTHRIHLLFKYDLLTNRLHSFDSWICNQQVTKVNSFFLCVFFLMSEIRQLLLLLLLYVINITLLLTEGPSRSVADICIPNVCKPAYLYKYWTESYAISESPTWTEYISLRTKHCQWA